MTTATTAVALRNSLTPATDRTPFQRDAALPAVTDGRTAQAHDALPLAFAAWRAQIAAEQLADFTCVIPSIRMDPRDGALTRDAGAGLAYTPRGWATLVSVTLQSDERRNRRVRKENNTANVTRVMLNPDARSLCWDGFKARSVRDAAAPVVLRTFVDVETGHRAVRATVTPRHALGAYDDTTMIAALSAELPASSTAFFNRTPDQTHGSVVLPDATPTGCGSVRSVVQFENSETGCASLSFTGGAFLTAIDTEVRFDSKKIERETTVQIAAEDTRTTRRHTAPARLGVEEAQAIALERLREDLGKVLAACRELPAAWNRALASYPAGLTEQAFVGMPADHRAAVLCDQLEEKNAITADDRALITEVIKGEERLGRIPQGSAAHVAACFAVAATKTNNWNEARRLQGIAGQWILNGWKK